MCCLSILVDPYLPTPWTSLFQCMQTTDSDVTCLYYQTCKQADNEGLTETPAPETVPR